jgi:SAM-dependent methyltransferase
VSADDAAAGRALSFGRAAGDYVAGRPGYPDEAVEWLVGDARRVADVGAGTGKLTAALVGNGRSVIAVDPDEAMLETLRGQVPGVETRLGTAEALPLEDGAFDAVVFGQAWHWVDPAHAAREVGRVLRPGGVLGLIWNIRDESRAWAAQLGAIMHGSDAERLIADGGPAVGAPFGALEGREFRWSRPMTPDEVVAMAASRSYVIALPEDERERLLGGVRELLATHSQTAGRDTVDLPYITYAYRALRPASA